MTATQTELALDDPRAEPVCPDPHEIVVDINVNLTLRVDIAKLAFLHREWIQGEETTKILDSDGYDEKERFDVWLHYFLLEGASFDVGVPQAEGVRDSWAAHPEVNFWLNDKDRAAVEDAFNPRWAVPAE